MNIENLCSDTGHTIDIKSFRRRSVIRRLWESYACDLIAILKLAAAGKISQKEAIESIEEIIPSMKSLCDGGEYEQSLHKANLIILDKVFNDVATLN